MVEAQSLIATSNRVKVVGAQPRQNKGLQLLIGRNRILILNIMKFLDYRRQALSLIGRLNRKYASFVKQDMTMFEILEKEKRSTHVGSDQEFAEFLRESGNTTKDFSIELYLRARYLPRFLQ